MFNNPKYMTKGIAVQLPLELQLYLWQMIVDLNRCHIPLDYLQVFKLDAITIGDQSLQQITHTQEIPPYKNTVTIRIDQPVSNRKVFCIDDQRHSTMLFAEEY